MLLSIFPSSGGHYPKSNQSAEFSDPVTWDGWLLGNVRREREQEGRLRRTEPGGYPGPWTPLVSWASL